ncbi:MAG: monovalent cation/H+ antiporter complex subunit F [Planctomycetota bacterium]
MSPQFVEIVRVVVMPLLGLAALLAGWRVLRGPTLADRVVGLELLTTIGIGLAAGAGVVADQPALLDVSLVLALVVFLGALAYARSLGSDR